MRAADKALILSAIRHTDNRSIVKCYTRSRGLVTVSAMVGRSASARIRPSAVQPLTFVDAVLSLREGQEVQTLTEASVYYAPDLSGSMPRLAVAMFMNELLVKCLKEQGANERLYDFIEHCLDRLQHSPDAYTTLHLYF